MVGTVFSRVLSGKSRISTASDEIVNEKYDYPQPTSAEIGSLDPTDVWCDQPALTTRDVVADVKPRICFDQQAKNKPSGTFLTLTAPRKHSYASVKEDADIPQFFTSRRLPFERDVPFGASVSSSKRPSFSEELTREAEELSEEDECAVSEGEASDVVEFQSRTDSFSHDSVLSATRSQPATLETMPDEILDLIFSLVTLDHAKDRYVDPKVDLFSCLLVSRAIHAAALRVLYRHVKIPQSKAFHKFNNSLKADTELGGLVQCLDFSHYSNIGFGRTRTTHQQKPYLTPSTLKACLDHTRNLRAFLVHEHVDDELDIAVLSRLFTMPSMVALDFCSCHSKLFTEALTEVCISESLSGGLKSMPFLSVERLSLHECTTLKAPLFQALLPKLVRLTHLDVAHTMIDNKALMSIPHMARITHLNLERCTQITGSTVVQFLTQHPAVRDTVVYLNLMADTSRYRLLSEDNLSELLPALPNTLRSLNIGGARVNSSHVPHLRALATHLEELGLKGANLGLSGDIAQILSLVMPESDGHDAHPEWCSSLRYIDLTDIKSVSKLSLHYSPTPITGLESVPLEVIELGPSILADIEKSTKKLKDPEWVVRELGRRGWYVRQQHLLPEGLCTPDDGYRSWKMGAKGWGMRKIPIFEQETGGMYGYYMFKRS